MMANFRAWASGSLDPGCATFHGREATPNFGYRPGPLWTRRARYSGPGRFRLLPGGGGWFLSNWGHFGPIPGMRDRLAFWADRVWGDRGLNPGPTDYASVALTA